MNYQCQFNTRSEYMKITKVNIPKGEYYEDGLEEINMNKLESIVLLAGKNGAGKTRVLNRIFSTLERKPVRSRFQGIDRDRAGYHLQLEFHQQQRDVAENAIKNSSDPAILENFRRNLENSIANINAYEQALINLDKEEKWSFIETDQLADGYPFVRFVPKQVDLIDSNSYTRHRQTEAATAIEQVGFEQLPSGALAKIQVIQDEWFNATHQGLTVPEDIKRDAIKNYERLQNIVEIFLNSEIGRTIKGDATLFGFPMGVANLSDGQKLLLQFCLAIYSQESSLKDMILVLDEPENHLHPSVIIETIERIRKCVTNGQIWISTHSIPLLAHFDPSLIWFVDNNRIEYGGRTPEKVLHSLLGGEEAIGRLQDFISLPSALASTRYAFECLCPPTILMTEKLDPQSKQIRESLTTIIGDQPLRVLDYGAGKGRIIANITDLDETDKVNLVGIIDYIAFDEYRDETFTCESSLIKAYGSAKDRYFNDLNTMFSVYDKESFDVVILCNVLHEIDPKDWLTLFQSEGRISSCLKENGKLLLVEDQQIPVGEKAHQKGFIVLDTPQLKELFQITEADTDFRFSDYRNDGRLKAHLIPKRLLTKISPHSRVKALESLSRFAKERISNVRKDKVTYKNGKLHGFWTQQFANSQLVISELKGE